MSANHQFTANSCTFNAVEGNQHNHQVTVNIVVYQSFIYEAVNWLANIRLLKRLKKKVSPSFSIISIVLTL
jgi:hypothetical protein